MSERRVFTMKVCTICREPIKQVARGRPRLTCSDACRQARYRFLKGKSSRRTNQRKKVVERRRNVPFIERSYETRFLEPVLELSYKRWVYECLACGKPYLVERIWSGGKVHPYCSQACEEKSRYHWEQFEQALARADAYRTRIDERVLERFDYMKLSPCAHAAGSRFHPTRRCSGSASEVDRANTARMRAALRLMSDGGRQRTGGRGCIDFAGVLSVGRSLTERTQWGGGESGSVGIHARRRSKSGCIGRD